MSMTREQVWERYVAAWKAGSADEKRALLRGSVADGCVYTDPVVRVEGHDALVDYMMGFLSQVPGGHFVTDRFFAHAAGSAARWTMRSGDGAPLGEGISVGAYDDRGHLVAMTGFFDVPSAG
ncbi:MAG: nuclear transport factor 2 family protein [Myxococcota bacterium]